MAADLRWWCRSGVGAPGWSDQSAKRSTLFTRVGGLVW
jgi:hypothetical protein